MLRKILLLTIVSVGLLTGNLWSQTQHGSIIPGKMMVQLTDIENLDAIKAFYGSSNLRVERILSHRLKIVLLAYDDSKIAADVLLDQVQKLPFVVNAQHEHIIQLRSAPEEGQNTPEDEFFDLQWGFNNTGQSGGLAGADIDALNAWDITTGGLTAFGDTIVVAVIDGGADINHNDLNIFINRHEIPGNGIDDDGNGYIDDVNGWNAYNNTGNVPAQSHGTHVSGTVGAIGNNEIGVTGVNWNVKVLPIAGSSSSESTVVAAYSYAYAMRALYNETDGEMGAFIVATNSSFGVDQGQPENYPIWGAMYDSMGAIGIVSAAATANRNWNIDEVSDIPTAFPSPYLISVTNTTHNDIKYATAGYGIETIDLGAPGTQIYSTRPNNNYGYSTGTSMATPHVAGAVALLLSAADSAFISFYKENPGTAALQLRQYILEGVDQLESLEGLMATGGRLNIYNSIMLLLEGELPPDEPEISIVPGSISASIYPGDTLSTTFVVLNPGEDTVYFHILVDEEAFWLSAQTDSAMLEPGENLTVQLHLDATALEAGIYQTPVLIDTYHNQQITLPVQLEVMNFPPIMIIQPDTITQDLIIAHDTLRSFRIWNDGGEPLFFSLQLFNETSWLSFEPTSGTVNPTDTANIELNINSFGLEPNNYSSLLMIKTDHEQIDSVYIGLLVYNPESVSDLATNSADVRVQPNPMTNFATFLINAQGKTSIRILISDLEGRNLKRVTLVPSDGKHVEWQWDATDENGKKLPSGLYFYQVVLDAEKHTGKIILN
jgi:subtilisin family serine protease